MAARPLILCCRVDENPTTRGWKWPRSCSILPALKSRTISLSTPRIVWSADAMVCPLSARDGIRRKSWHSYLSVDPAPGLVFLLLLAHVDFKFPAQPGTSPLVIAQLHLVRKAGATEVEEAEQHASQMRDVAHPGARRAER